MLAFCYGDKLGQSPLRKIIKPIVGVSKLTLSHGRVSARAFASKSIHGRRVIILAKTCGKLTASPYIRAGRLGYYGGTYENVFL